MEDWMKKALLQKINGNKVTASKPSPKKKVKVNIHLDTSADRRGGNKAASGHYRDRNRDRRAESRAPEAMASAPYNFVSLPHRILPAPFAVDGEATEADELIRDYKKYVSSEGKNTGYIRLEIQVLTPLFIGCCTGSKETDAFFSSLGRPVIPGSSIRGMTRNLFKIITAGALRKDEDFTDRHLYFRGLASRLGSFRDYYKDRMVEIKDDGKEASKTDAGFLIRNRKTGSYFICPADYYRTKVDNPYSINGGPAVRWSKDGADIITGPMNGKKHYFTINHCDTNPKRRIPVPDEVIRDYKSDSTRFSGNAQNKCWNLFTRYVAKTDEDARGFAHMEDIDFIVPCFYIAQDGIVQHFGHGRNYRIPYDSSISDHIPAGLRKDTPDFVDAVFGRKELWAGRVSFEDGEMTVEGTAIPANYPRPLMGPNPTSFQLYLKQDGWPPKHWDEKTDIRGYKLYWHRNQGKFDWVLDPAKNKIVKGMKKIAPLGPGTHFKSKIRFDRLSDVELGALLNVFGLDDGKHDVVYKLGRGKSIGMGSVRIKASLYLENSRERYSSLFSGDSWKEAEKENDGLAFKNAFRQYLADHLKDEKPVYENLMEELRTMLDWNNVNAPDWKDKTDMMPIGDKADTRFRDRVILDNPRDFVRKKFKK